MKLWRLSCLPDLSGRGGLNAPARWHHQGRPILYAATEPPGALVEVLVHLDVAADEIPDDYVLTGIEVPDAFCAVAAVPTLLPNWNMDTTHTRDVGSQWLSTGSSLLMRVPSAISDQTDNFVLNPLHLDMAGCSIVYQQPFVFDVRLLGT